MRIVKKLVGRARRRRGPRRRPGIAVEPLPYQKVKLKGGHVIKARRILQSDECTIVYEDPKGRLRVKRLCINVED